MNFSKYFLSFVLFAGTAAGADLTGFPFRNETLRYNIKIGGGVSLGDATVSAARTDSGWRFEMNFTAGVPGFPLADTYRSTASPEFCSNTLDRSIVHGTKKVMEKTTFDQKQRTAERQTTIPAGGGKSELSLPPCAMDALAYSFLTRQEMGQGRMPQAAKVFFGSAYDVRVDYTGAMEIPSGGKTVVTDHVNVFIKGPASNLTVEVFYARDAARTPLLYKIPVSIGAVSLELVRN